MYWQNTVDGYCDGKEALCRKIADFINENTEWVRKKLDTSSHKAGSNPYWHQIGLIYDQLQGLEDGYDTKVSKSNRPR